MSEKDTGRPAFPGHIIKCDEVGEYAELSTGITVRDYFAAQTMKMHMQGLADARIENWHAEISKLAYETADAMLEARKS